MWTDGAYSGLADGQLSDATFKPVARFVRYPITVNYPSGPVDQVLMLEADAQGNVHGFFFDPRTALGSPVIGQYPNLSNGIDYLPTMNGTLTGNHLSAQQTNSAGIVEFSFSGDVDPNTLILTGTLIYVIGGQSWTDPIIGCPS